jgi:hypothetical protein
MVTAELDLYGEFYPFTFIFEDNFETGRTGFRLYTGGNI